MKATPSMNPYFYGSLVLLTFWGLTLVVLRSRRMVPQLREFWWASFTCTLLGFSEPLFVPEYWSPPSVLSLGRWDLESFLFCFAIGGIAAVLPEIPTAKSTFFAMNYHAARIAKGLGSVVIRSLTPTALGDETTPAPRSEVRLTKRELRSENMVLVAFLLGAFGATTQLKLNIIYDVAITCIAMAGFIGWRTPKLRWQIVSGGVRFLGMYSIVLWIVQARYPDFYVEHWNLAALSGKWLLGVPAEEYLFAFTMGMFWAPLYETWKDVRSAPDGRPRGVCMESVGPTRLVP